MPLYICVFFTPMCVREGGGVTVPPFLVVDTYIEREERRKTKQPKERTKKKKREKKASRKTHTQWVDRERGREKQIDAPTPQQTKTTTHTHTKKQQHHAYLSKTQILVCFSFPKSSYPLSSLTWRPWPPPGASQGQRGRHLRRRSAPFGWPARP